MWSLNSSYDYIPYPCRGAYVSYTMDATAVSYMFGTTFYPTQRFTDMPRVFQSYITSKWDSALNPLYNCMPGLCFKPKLDTNKNPHIMLESIIHVLQNIHCNENGFITHISNVYLRYMMVCYSMAKYGQADGTLYSCYKYDPPDMVKESAPFHMQPEKHQYKPHAVSCEGIHHQIGYNTTPCKRSQFFFGRNICETCYTKYYVEPPIDWVNVNVWDFVFTADVLDNILRPLTTIPIGFILRGAAYTYGTPYNQINEDILCAAAWTVETAPGLWALYRKPVQGEIHLWKSIAAPEHRQHLHIIAKQTTNEKARQNKTRLTLYPHMKDIMELGWKEVMVPLNGKRVYKKENLTNIDDIFVPEDILLYVQTDTRPELRIYSMACLQLMNRLQYNVPPLEVEIILTASHLRPLTATNVFHRPKKTYDASTFSFVSTFFAPGDEIICKHSEFLTWETLYYIIQKTHCTKICLMGCYSTSVVGVHTHFSPLLHGHVFKVLTRMAEMRSFSDHPGNVDIIMPEADMHYTISPTEHTPFSHDPNAQGIHDAEQKIVDEKKPIWELNTRNMALTLLGRPSTNCLPDQNVPMKNIPQRLGCMPGIYLTEPHLHQTP